MKVQHSSYKQIMKATSVFGGVQVFNIIITIIRTKLVAVLLGPSGMGIVSLLTSTTGFIEALTSFGLSKSAIKNVAASFATGDMHKLGTTVAVFRKLVWFTGLLGFLVTLTLAPWLSEIAFGNKSYTVAFVLISVTLLLTQISAGQGVILRGTRKIHAMAKSSMIGAVIGLIISVPLYYLFGEAGIVPAIIVSSILALTVTWYFSKQVNIPKVEVRRETVLDEGKDMLRMGIFISMSGLITVGASYLFRIYISNNGGVEDVGLYNAGFAIINTYVGMIFTAMGTDYFPRLAAIAHDKTKTNNEINQQAEIALLILSPILIIFLVYINWAVILLYSEKFIPVTTMIHWAALGIFFKAVSWAIGFIILAQGAGKLFFWSEVIANSYILVLNVLGYNYMGLTGLGISFFIAYVLVLIQVFIIAKKKYSYNISSGLLKIFIVQFVLALSCFLIVQLLERIWAYSVGTCLIVASSVYSLFELDNRLGVIKILNNLLIRFKSK
jgi:O-antigen/teichoic acid export membrane protein